MTRAFRRATLLVRTPADTPGSIYVGIKDKLIIRFALIRFDV